MSYGNVVDHREMVFDETRNALYRRALRETLAPGARVMDLGAGLGILGLIALQEGASEVVMVEPAPVVEATRKLVRSLGVEDRVRIIDRRIEAVTETFEVDVIVSVFTGNFLLEEDLLPSLFHARDRFLAPGGALLPDAARMVVAPVEAAGLHDTHVRRWSTPASDIDVSSLRSFAENSLVPALRGSERPRALAAEQGLADLDFATASEAACDATVGFVAESDGVCHGLLGWFEARLGGHWFSTGPEGPDLHWSPVFLPLAEPVPVRAGQALQARVHRPTYGEWTWSVECGDRHQRQSTFLANAASARALQRRAPSYRPRLGEEGAALQHLLTRFDGTRSLEAIADELMAAFPKLYPNRELAFRTVQSLSARYAAGARE